MKQLKECYFDKDICLSDYKPLFITFDITENLNNC